MKKRNKLLAYILDRRYYLSLLGCLIVTAVAVGIIYSKGGEDQEIASLNEVMRTEELVENPIEQAVIDEEEIIHEQMTPAVTVHGEVVEEDSPVVVETIVPEATMEEATNDEEDGESVEAFSNDSAKAEETVSEEPVSGELKVFNPVIEVKLANLAFTAESKIMLPTTGTVILDYNETVPAYFKTLDQYKINTSMCIASEYGAEVKAAADGVIESITLDDYSKGNLITIYHGNGYKTVYGQLQKDMNVEEGDSVVKGTIIGYVDNPTSSYSLEGSHLYFQVLKDDKPVNPNELIQ